MLKKRGIAVWMALIMLFSCFPVQVFAAGASITNERAEGISETNATFKAVLNNPTGIQPSEVGIYFGESQGSMYLAAKDTYVYNQAYLDFWYNANTDMGITLQPATTYWYRLYANINGQVIWGSYKTMKTAGQAVQQTKPQPSSQPSPQAFFGNERVNDKTETNGTFYGVLNNPTGIQPSEVGCYIGKSADTMKLLGRDTYVYNRPSLEVWYNAGDEGVRLEPGTKYYYQFYAVIGGQKVMGDKKSVTTNGTAAAAHTHDWKTMVEKAHPHKSVRSCACGVSELVKGSNYVSGCAACNPPKAEAVKKTIFENGIYEISNHAGGKFLNAYAEGSGWKVVTVDGDGSAEQRFTLKGSNGNYAIQTQGYGGRGLYLNGSALLTGQTDQFCFVNRGNGYTISSANDPSKVLTQTDTAMYGGDHVVSLQNYTGAANQLWTLRLKATDFVLPVSAAYKTGYYKAARHNVPVYSASNPQKVISYLYEGEIVYIEKLTDVNSRKRGSLKKWDYKSSNLNGPFYGGYADMQDLIKIEPPGQGESYAKRAEGLAEMLTGRQLDQELFCEYNYAVDFVEKKYEKLLKKTNNYTWQSAYVTVLNNLLSGEEYDLFADSSRDNTMWDDAVEIAGILDWSGIINFIAASSEEASKKFVTDMEDLLFLVELSQNTSDENLKVAARCVICNQYQELQKTAVMYGFGDKLLTYLEKLLGESVFKNILALANGAKDIIDLWGVVSGEKTNERLAVEIMACDEIRNTMSVVFHKNLQASGETADLRAIRNWEAAQNAMTEAYNRIQPIVGYEKFWEEYYKEGGLYKGVNVSNTRIRTYFTK